MNRTIHNTSPKRFAYSMNRLHDNTPHTEYEIKKSEETEVYCMIHFIYMRDTMSLATISRENIRRTIINYTKRWYHTSLIFSYHDGRQQKKKNQPSQIAIELALSKHNHTVLKHNTSPDPEISTRQQPPNRCIRENTYLVNNGYCRTESECERGSPHCDNSWS